MAQGLSHLTSSGSAERIPVLASGQRHVLVVGVEAMEAIERQRHTGFHLEAQGAETLQPMEIREHGVATQTLPAGIVPGGIPHLAGATGQPLHVAIEQGNAHGGGGIDAKTATEGAGEAAGEVGGAAPTVRRQLRCGVWGRGLRPEPWG